MCIYILILFTNTTTSSIWFACINFGCWTYLFHILRYMLCQFGLIISYLASHALPVWSYFISCVTCFASLVLLFHILRHMLCQFGLIISYLASHALPVWSYYFISCVTCFASLVLLFHFIIFIIFAVTRRSSFEWIQKNGFPCTIFGSHNTCTLDSTSFLFLEDSVALVRTMHTALCCMDKSEIRINAIHSLLPIWLSFCAAAWNVISVLYWRAIHAMN